MTQRCPVCRHDHEVKADLAGVPVIECPEMPSHGWYFLNHKYMRFLSEGELRAIAAENN